LEHWNSVLHLFKNDDGSLPDIFIENLTENEIITIYNWIVSNSEIYNNPTLWSIEEQKDVPIKQIVNPAKNFVEGRVECFHHGLENLKMDGVIIPQLGIFVENGRLSLDYRMGLEWEPIEVEALFKLLYSMVKSAPNLKVRHADEGCYDKPNKEFTDAFAKYVKEKKAL